MSAWPWVLGGVAVAGGAVVAVVLYRRKADAEKSAAEKAAAEAAAAEKAAREEQAKQNAKAAAAAGRLVQLRAELADLERKKAEAERNVSTARLYLDGNPSDENLRIYREAAAAATQYDAQIEKLKRQINEEAVVQRGNVVLRNGLGLIYA